MKPSINNSITMTVHIENLEFLAIIGILDFERTQSQKVIVESTLTYNYEQNQFINYADVIEFIEKWIQEKKFELLEDALSSVQKELLTKYPNINELYIKISKPTIMKNASVALSLKWLKL